MDGRITGGVTAGRAGVRRPPPRAPRKLVKAVRTHDGPKIRLYDGITYDVAASAAPPAAVEVRVKAGVIAGGDDVKAVARLIHRL